MSFIKNIIDLRGILTLMVLTLPSIAANIDCNGKPFHCVNSTHFMICVDIGSGVSTTIDDFVIPCPPTTVCQGTNRFECEFIAVTTTVAPSVVPLVSVSETKETVSALYEVTTSIPSEEYNNTFLTTTLSEDVLSTHQTIATEPTLTESTIVTDVKQNIDVIKSESNSTLIENVLDADVVHNYITTFKPLSMNTPANAIESITETTENVTGNSETVLATSETTPSVEVVQNDVTTLAPLLYNTSGADLIPNATENINIITPKSETNSIVIENEPIPLSTSTGFTLPFVNDITTESILTKGVKLTPSASTISYTTPSSTSVKNDISLTTTSLPDIILVNTASSVVSISTDATDINIITLEPRANSSVEVVQNDFTTLVPLLNNTSAGTTDLIFNATENISVITPKPEINPNLPDNAQNEPGSLSTSTDFILHFANVITTESILTEVEFTQSESTLSYTTPSSTFNDISFTSTSLLDNIPVATASNTGLNSDATDVKITPEPRANTTSTESITIIEVVHNEPTSFPTSSSSVLLIDITDPTTESILTKVTEPILIDSVGVVLNDVTIHTPLSYDRSDNVMDLISNATETVNVIIPESETNSILNETSSNLDVVQNDLTTPIPHNINANATDLIPDVTEKIDVIVPESENNSTLNKTILNSTNIVQNYTHLDTLGTTYLPNYNVNTVTESILETSASIDIGNNTALHDKISHDVTESTVNNVTEKINVMITETTQTLSQSTPRVAVDISQDPNKVAVQGNNITENKVTSVTDNTNLAETESVYNTLTETTSTESVDILNFNTTTQSSISASLNNTTAIVAQTIITDITENKKNVETESNYDLTLSGNLASGSETSPPYIQSVTVIPIITVPIATTATTDNLLTVLVNEINRANTTDKYKQNVTDENHTTEAFTTPSIEITSTTYQGSSVTASSNTNLETTPNFNAATTVSAQEVRFTHGNVYYHTDTENIENDQRVLTTHTDSKFILSEKVLSTDTIDNKASTPTLVVNKENLFISTLVSATTTEVTEPTTNLIDESPVLATHPSTDFVPITKEPTNSFETYLYSSVTSADGIIARPTLNNNNVQQPTESLIDSSTSPTIQITEVITTEQTTLLTNVISTTQVSVSESIVSSDFLPNPIDVNKMISDPKLKNILIETPTIAMTSTTTDSLTILGSYKSKNTGSPATLIEKDITDHFGIKIDVDHDTTNNILNTNVKPTPVIVNSERMNADISVPIFYPTTEDANKIYSYFELPQNKDSVTGKSDNTLDLTQTTRSLLEENVKSGVRVLDEPGLNINSSNTTQTETSNSITPELVTSSLHEPPIKNTAAIAMAATTESTMFTEKHNTNILKSTVDANILSTVKICTETTKDNSPLINLLLNSPVEQIPYKEPAVPNNLISLESVLIQNETEKNAFQTHSTHVNENVAFIGSTQQESYTESIINHTDMSLQTSLLNAANVVRIIELKGQGIDITPSSVEPDTYKSLSHVTPENHTPALDLSTQPKQVDPIKSSQSPLDSIDNRPPHQDFTTEKQINPNVLTDIISEPPQQVPTTNDYEKNIPGTNKITANFLEQATKPSIDNLKTKLAHNLAINTATTETIENTATIADGYIMVLKQAKTTETDNPTTFDRPIEVSKPTEVTKPYVPITSQLITEQPMIDTTSTKPWGKTPLISDFTTQTVSRPYVNHVVSNPETQFIYASQYFTSPKTVDKNPAIGVQSTSGLTTESSKVPQASEITVQTTSQPSTVNLIQIALNPRVGITNGPKNNVVQPEKQHVVTISETEFINIPKAVVTESTRPVDTLNSDTDIVVNVPVLVENSLATGTHSGISVLQKPPRGTKPKQSEESEWSENAENPQRKKEKGSSKDTEEENTEASESIEGLPNNISPAIDTTSKYLKSSRGLVNEKNLNENIGLTETPKTSNSKSPTNEMRSKSTIEMTTTKMEEASISGYESIANIELLSTTMKSTENFRQASTHLPDSSIKIEPTVTARIKNSTARFSPKPKPRLTINATVSAFKPATNTFICKQNSRGRFPDSKNCRKFYICFGKPEPIEGFCPNNTVFSELRKQCTKNLSHCVRNNQFQCISEGRFSDYLNDNNYYICVKNNVGTFIRFKLQCQSGYHLNRTTVRCVLNQEASQSKSDTSKNISDLSASSAKSEKLVIESSIEFECINEGRFPDANDCRKYYICTKKGKSHYRRKSKKCDSDELFHKDKKKCVDADSYECS